MLNNKTITVHCSKCGKSFKTNNENHTLCRDCFNKKNEVVETIVCKDCGQEFTMTRGEKEYYDNLGYQSPIRCKACRTARKEKMAKKSD